MRAARPLELCRRLQNRRYSGDRRARAARRSGGGTHVRPATARRPGSGGAHARRNGGGGVHASGRSAGRRRTRGGWRAESARGRRATPACGDGRELLLELHPLSPPFLLSCLLSPSPLLLPTSGGGRAASARRPLAPLLAFPRAGHGPCSLRAPAAGEGVRAERRGRAGGARMARGGRCCAGPRPRVTMAEERYSSRFGGSCPLPVR